MNANEIIINKFILTQPKLSITKTKTDRIYIKDGFVNYCIKLIPLYCPCNKELICNHTIYILNSVYKIEFNVIVFFHRLLPVFYSNIKNPNVNLMLQQTLNDEILSQDCGICMEKLVKDLIECEVCKQYSHKKCLQKWLKFNKNEKKCIYCNE